MAAGSERAKRCVGVPPSNAKINYKQLMAELFGRNYKKGATSVPFTRDQIVEFAATMKMDRPDNLGDLIYSFRYRTKMPDSITATAPKGKEWVIIGAGNAKYKFQLFDAAQIIPRKDMEPVKIPRATPEIVIRYARSEEQALLAVVRYNRLVDMFLGVSAYSLQSHLKTKVPNIGQIEIDEVYVGVNKQGAQFIIPVQAKGGNDKLGIVQVMQDAEFCKNMFPDLVPRLIAAQFIDDNHVAMLELVVTETGAKIRQEQHYLLVAADKISSADLKSYRSSVPD